MPARHPWLIPSRPQQRQPLRAMHRMASEPTNATPLEIAVNRAAALPPNERLEVIAPARAAFGAFRAGRGNSKDWAHLVDTVNVGMELARHQIASDHKPTFEAAGQALTAVHDRQAITGSWTLKGTEIAALDLAVFVHGVQLQHCSRGELGKAVTTVIARVKAALSGHPAPGTRICEPGQPTTNAPT